MNHKRLLLTALILVVMAQLFVPFQMISKQADYASSGTEFQFRIRHNRPNGYMGGFSGSSMQGKYIWLPLEQDRFKVAGKKDWNYVQAVFVSFTKDSLGNAKILSVGKTKPSGSDWIKAKSFLTDRDSTVLHLSYPFSNYFIADKDTRDIDSAYTKKMNDSLSAISLKVKIKDNQFIVNDLMVDSLTFKEFVKKIRDKRKH
jgi:hypothetical protein